MLEPRVVFISYAHGTSEEDALVAALALRIASTGLIVVKDTDIDGMPAEGWPAWCEKQLDSADFVIMVCTSTYARRYEGDEPPGVGRGVTWEANLIRAMVYEAVALRNKFVPIVFCQADRSCVPLIFRGLETYTMPADELALIRHLRTSPTATEVRRRLVELQNKRAAATQGHWFMGIEGIMAISMMTLSDFAALNRAMTLLLSLDPGGRLIAQTVPFPEISRVVAKAVAIREGRKTSRFWDDEPPSLFDITLIDRDVLWDLNRAFERGALESGSWPMLDFFVNAYILSPRFAFTGFGCRVGDLGPLSHLFDGGRASNREEETISQRLIAHYDSHQCYPYYPLSRDAWSMLSDAERSERDVLLKAGELCRALSKFISVKALSCTGLEWALQSPFDPLLEAALAHVSAYPHQVQDRPSIDEGAAQANAPLHFRAVVPFPSFLSRALVRCANLSDLPAVLVEMRAEFTALCACLGDLRRAVVSGESVDSCDTTARAFLKEWSSIAGAAANSRELTVATVIWRPCLASVGSRSQVRGGERVWRAHVQFESLLSHAIDFCRDAFPERFAHWFDTTYLLEAVASRDSEARVAAAAVDRLISDLQMIKGDAAMPPVIKSEGTASPVIKGGRANLRLIRGGGGK